MSLMISIIKSSDAVNVIETSKSFEVEGGTIGRGVDNTWVLEDPERYLSACHCKISFEQGQFYITDSSTNGTFYNGSPNPIGKGSKLPLKDGDNFIVGDYEFLVSYSNSAEHQSSAIDADPFSDSSFASPFASSNGFDSPLNSTSDPFTSGFVSASDSLFDNSSAETDPLAALDKAQNRHENQPDFYPQADPFNPSTPAPAFHESTFSDRADPINQQISWPQAMPENSADEKGVIPDDWDDFFSGSAAFEASTQSVQPTPLTRPPLVPNPAERQNSEQQTDPFSTNHAEHNQLAKDYAKIRAELESLKQQVNSRQPDQASDVSVDTSLIQSLGLNKHNLNDDQISSINALGGEVIREMVKGLMQVLGSRGSVKNEFRMHVTTIQPVENNPIKFSANVDDALENMFVKQGNSYKKPVEAVQEGFESVAEHQVAILAGIKSAFRGVIERFDPVILEQRFSKQSKGGIIPGSQKAKNWDLFNQYYNELADDLDNSFQYLFGDDFVRAYEEKLQQMIIAKKANKAAIDK